MSTTVATSTGDDTTGSGTSTDADASATSGTSTTGGSSSDGSSSEGSSSTGPAGDCGDGTRDPAELCDDGNAVDDDGCDADCVPSVAVQIAVGNAEHTCALTRTGAVRCWGSGALGRLGYGNVEDIGDDEDPAEAGSIDVGGVVVQISAGYSHTCALLDDGAVRCWGGGELGEIGYGNTATVGDDETPADAGDVDIGGVAVHIVAGGSHSCALLEGGSVRCWGDSISGQLGYGNTDPIGDTEAPSSAGDIDVGGTGMVVQLAAGAAHTCARLDTGAVRCWGNNAFGQLGLGHTESVGSFDFPSDHPDVEILDPDSNDEVVHVAAAYYHTCALLMSGNVRCWGNSDVGQTGYATTENIGDEPGETPASMGDISLGGTVVELNAGPCARLDDGAVRCWGIGDSGALGLGDTEEIGDDESPSAVDPIPLGSAAVHQHSSGFHACAVLDTGDLRCWGANFRGQLGYGNTEAIGDDAGETPDTVDPVRLF